MAPRTVANFSLCTLTVNLYPWIFGTITERIFWKKKSRIIASDLTLRSEFFPQNTLGYDPAFWIFFSGFTDKDSKSTFRTIHQVFCCYLTSKNKITDVYAILNSISRFQFFYNFQRALKFHPLDSPKILLLFLVQASLSFINIVVRTARQCQAYF